MNKPIDISNVYLHSERLIIRPWKQSDLKDFYEYSKVDGVGQWAGWLPHKNIEESQMILNMFIEGKKVFALEYEGKVIGSLGVERYSEDILPELDNLQGRELGYVLSKDYWGQGIMPEAVKEVTRYLFEVENLDFIIICHFVRNARSRRVIEKCGYKYIKDSTYNTHYGTVENTRVNILYNPKKPL